MWAYLRNRAYGFNTQTCMQLINVGNFRSKKHNNQGLLLILRGKGAIITQNLVVEYDIMKIHKKQHHQRLKKILLTTKFEKTIYSTQK